MERLDADSILGMFETTPSLVVYRDYDRDGLLQRANDLSREVGKELPLDGGDLGNLEIVLFSVLNVLTEKISSERLTRSQRTVVLDKESVESAYELLADTLRADPRLALELDRAWTSRLLGFLHAESMKSPQMPVSRFLSEAAEAFRINSLLAIRVFNSILASASSPRL